MERIKEVAFRECSNLKSIIIPEGVSEIEKQTFLFCIRLENVILPNSLRKIGYQAFEVCHALKSIKIPPLVDSFGDACFGACPLKEFYIAKGTKLDKSHIFYGYGVRKGVPEQIIEY
jgi:hypothetical protein